MNQYGLAWFGGAPITGMQPIIKSISECGVYIT